MSLPVSRASQPPIVPIPIGAAQNVWRDLFPEHRVTQSAQTQLRNCIEVLRAVFMARVRYLVAKGISDPRYSAFDTAPNFDRCYHRVPRRCGNAPAPYRPGSSNRQFQIGIGRRPPRLTLS